MDALTTRDVVKHYSRTEALRGVSLSVTHGEVVALLGPNGAGKSTLTKVACGLVRPSSGKATIEGHPAGSIEARRQIGYLAELFRFPSWCTASELLELHQRLAPSSGGEAERRELLSLVALSDAADTRVGAMSKGMQQRLGIAQALVGEPSLLLLDEPTSALDPVGRRIVRELLEGTRARGISVLLNSHLLTEVELVCDRVAIVVDGRIVAEGSPSELAAAGGVRVETAAGEKRFAGGREQVPEIVADLVAAGERIYSVSLVEGTLEETYLKAVGERTS